MLEDLDGAIAERRTLDALQLLKKAEKLAPSREKGASEPPKAEQLQRYVVDTAFSRNYSPL